jgi:hypothetical protein
MLAPLSGGLGPLGSRSGRPSFNPLAYGDCSLWLPADRLAISDGAQIATWTDYSGNAWDPTQAGAGKPTMDIDGAPNGGQAVRFLATSSQYLERTTFNGLAGKTGALLLLVAKNTRTNANETPYYSGNTFGVQIFSNTINYRVNGGSYGQGGAFTDVTWHIFEMAVDLTQLGDNGKLQVRIDGIVKSLSFAGSSLDALSVFPSTTGLLLAKVGTNALYFDGWIAEVVLFNAAKSLADRDAMVASLGAKWGITV